MSQINIDANNALLDHLLEKMHLKNDAALSRILEVAPPVISKLRHGRLDFGDTLIVRVHERADIPVREIKASLGKPMLSPHVMTLQKAA